jgi:hypothetical protein
MVGSIILRNQKFLRQLAITSSDKIRKKIISQASVDELLAVVEICTNILKDRFRPRVNHRKKLIEVAPYIRKIARARSPTTARRLLSIGTQSIFRSLILPVLAATGRYE